MFFENINFNSGELNSGILVVKQAVDKDPTAYQGYGDYRPSKVFVANTSGKEVQYGLMTAKEYALYIGVSGNLYSDLKPIATSVTDEFTNPRGEVSYFLASGTSGHTGGLNIHLARE